MWRTSGSTSVTYRNSKNKNNNQWMNQRSTIKWEHINKYNKHTSKYACNYNTQGGTKMQLLAIDGRASTRTHARTHAQKHPHKLTWKSWPSGSEVRTLKFISRNRCSNTCLSICHSYASNTHTQTYAQAHKNAHTYLERLIGAFWQRGAHIEVQHLTQPLQQRLFVH